METPIALFIYNRPRAARQLFASLLQCARLAECHVHIFCDGAKRLEHEDGVRAARQVVDEFAPRFRATVIKHEQNLGLARSVVAGVTELCATYGRVIVLEDDFILHPAFLDFMLQSLKRYETDERVAQIAGFTFPIQTSPQPDTFFLPLTTSWGWSTWARAWKLFSWEAQSYLPLLESNPDLRKRFDLNGTYPYYDMLRRAINGEVDSWAILWYLATFRADKLTLYPRESLVWQNGFDETATHTRGNANGLQKPLQDFLATKWNMEFSFPPEVRANSVLFDRLKKFLNALNHPSITIQLFSYIRTRAKRLFDKIGA